MPIPAVYSEILQRWSEMAVHAVVLAAVLVVVSSQKLWTHHTTPQFQSSPRGGKGL